MISVSTFPVRSSLRPASSSSRAPHSSRRRPAGVRRRARRDRRRPQRDLPRRHRPGWGDDPPAARRHPLHRRDARPRRASGECRERGDLRRHAGRARVRRREDLHRSPRLVPAAERRLLRRGRADRDRQIRVDCRAPHDVHVHRRARPRRRRLRRRGSPHLLPDQPRPLRFARELGLENLNTGHLRPQGRPNPPSTPTPTSPGTPPPGAA